MIAIEVNDVPVQARAGQMLLGVLGQAGIRVPTLCNVAGLPPTGACRLCVVEVEGRRGLPPSCATPVTAGMKVRTHSPRVVRARKTILELLLANHPDDCLYCARNRHCELQALAGELGVRQRRYAGEKSGGEVDASSPPIIREPAKCILCGRCVRVCQEIQGVGAIDFIGRGCRTRVGAAVEQGLNASGCVHCGLCVTACPTGALREQSGLREVVGALADPGRYVVAQHAPMVSVTLAEEFGLKAGLDAFGTVTAALRRLGFRRVFDTSLAADLAAMEQAGELVRRIRDGGRLPMLTSCSPSGIRFVERLYPDLLANLSTCKSPQQVLGAVIKSCFADRQGIDPRGVFCVSIVPCAAKKLEAGRAGHAGPAEMPGDGPGDIDAVLTSRELAQLIRLRGLDLVAMAPDAADTPFGLRSSTARPFGGSGGAMEAAIRSAFFMLTGRELERLEVRAIRGSEGNREARIKLDGLELGAAVVSGLLSARRLLEDIRSGRNDLHFVEVMTCPGGCIAGGGQPFTADPAGLRARRQALRRVDREPAACAPHANHDVRRLYEEFLGEPLGEESRRLLHTHHAGSEQSP